MIDFRCHGFATTPVGLIEVISRSSVPKDSIVYIIDPIGTGLPTVQDFKDLDLSRLWIVINTHEPATYVWFDRLLVHLTITCKVDSSRIILHSSCLSDPESSIHHIGSIVDYATDIVNQLGRHLQPGQPKHHFVCLNRSHRWQRRALVDLLDQRNLSKFGKISYLGSPNPLVLDTTEAAWEKQRDIDHPDIQDAVINVITETAYESKITEPKIQTHYRPCITEKTFKSIYLCQFPVWVSAQNTVGCVRDLGFDVFDDIIDHAYDQQPDPQQRLLEICDEIQRLVQIPISQWIQTRSTNMERFQANLDRLVWFNLNHLYELPKWNSIFG